VERAKKVMFVSHLLLNQNAMAKGKERAAGIVKDVIELLAEADIGIVQVPCPELDAFGLDRTPKSKDALDTKPFRASCRKLACSVLEQVEMYLKKNYNVVGVLGVEFSPTWAVHQLENGSRATPGKGVFIEELEDEMRKKRFQVPIIGVNLNNIFSSSEKIQALINSA
jgi:predicted secreted protein